MKKLSNLHVPKVLVAFMIGQITVFISSKEFKKRTMEFLSDSVDDVVNLAYNEAHEHDSKE